LDDIYPEILDYYLKVPHMKGRKQLIMIIVNYREYPLGYIITSVDHHLRHLGKGSRDYVEVLAQVKSAKVGKHLIVKALMPGLRGLSKLKMRVEFNY
jgi:hypothetical protein